jgi:two-component sensor histidine kinase
MRRKRQLTQLPLIWQDETALLARISEEQSLLVRDTLARAQESERYAQENAQLTLDLSGTQAALQGSVDRIQEVHHRVRNHLQMLTGLLSAEEVTEESASARRALQKSIARITSVAAIHDLLARDPRSGKLQLPDLVSRLVGHLLGSAAAEARVATTLEVAPVDLPQRESTAFVLILAELVCNAVEHGFADGACGQISVRIADEDSQVVLEVADDGAGLQPDFNWTSADSLGLGLVLRLAERDLNGSAMAWNDSGAHFRVQFPIPTAERGNR